MRKLIFKFMLFLSNVSSKYVYNHSAPSDNGFWDDGDLL